MNYAVTVTAKPLKIFNTIVFSVLVLVMDNKNALIIISTITADFLNLASL